MTSTTLDELTHVPATDVKRIGWRAISDAMPAGPVVITTYGRPAGVVLSLAEYERMSTVAELADADELSKLRMAFDQRLASLRAPDADDRLRAAFDDGQVSGIPVAGSAF